MAKRKNKMTEDLTQPTDLINDLLPPAQPPSDEVVDVLAVIDAAKALVEHYALTHTIHNFDSYKYPKMKELAIALSKI